VLTEVPPILSGQIAKIRLCHPERSEGSIWITLARDALLMNNPSLSS
jgi:hypothetical protein